MLAGLLLSSLARAKVTADGAVCRNNLHQFGIAFRMYLDELHCYPDVPTRSLEPYLNAKTPGDDGGAYKPDRSVWICPAYHRLGLVDDASLSSFSYGYNFEGYAHNYYNLWHGLHDAGSGPGGAVSETDVLAPSDMIAYGDSVLGLALGLPATQSPFIMITSAQNPAINSTTVYLFEVYHGGMQSLDLAVENWWNYHILYGLVSPPLPVPPPNGTLWSSDNPYQQVYNPNVTQAYRRRHVGRWNLLFCDGHTENVRPQDAFDTRKPEQMQRWNRDHEPHTEAQGPGGINTP